MFKYFIIAILSLYLQATENNITTIQLDKTLEKQSINKKTILNNILKEKLTNISFKSIEEQIEELKNKILLNKSKNNTLAVKRDNVKLANLKNIKTLNELEHTLISLRQQMESKKNILNTIDSYINALNSKKWTKSTKDNKIAKEYNKQIETYNNNKTKILDTMLYFKRHAEQIEKTNAIMRFKIINIAKYINSIKEVKKINIYLKHFLGIKLGEIVLVFLYIILLLFAKFIIRPIYTRIVNNIITKNKNDLSIIVREKFEIILNILIVVITINIMVDILFPYLSVHDWFKTTMKVAYIFIGLWSLDKIISLSIDVSSKELIKNNPDLRKEVILFIKRVITIILFVIFVATTLYLFGVNIMALLGGISFFGLGFSLAFKDTFSNFLGSVNLIFDQPFSIGDWIEVDSIEGTVIEVGMRKTRIRGFANNEYSIPNSILANAIVSNWSKRKMGRRIKLKVGVKYNSSPEKLQKATKDIYNFLLKHPRIMNREFNLDIYKHHSPLILKEDDHGIKKNLMVFVDNLGESSIDILIYCFARTLEWKEYLGIKEEVIYGVIDIIKKNNLSFAFPTQTIEIETSCREKLIHN